MTDKHKELFSLHLNDEKLFDQKTKFLSGLMKPVISFMINDDKQHIRTFVDQHLLSRDSIALRREINRISPDIELSQEIEIGGESVKVSIPMTVGFFWSDA